LGGTPLGCEPPSDRKPADGPNAVAERGKAYRPVSEANKRYDMSEAAAKAFELFQADVGNDEGTGEWFEVTQDQINKFADVTIDHQFIHVDPERAKATPFGTTIAHGFLTLSMLTHLAAGASSAPPDPAKYAGVLMGINYGFNKVRFVNPVKVGSRIRARAVTTNVELKGNSIEVTRNFTVEIEGEAKPALVADWLTRTVYA
jgi:acyl dehydratase